MFWGPWGMGRLEGAHGSRSRGDPHRKEELFSSPRLFQTRELGQRRVMIWRVAHRLSTIPRCWGQLLYWANTVDRGFWVIIWLLVILDETRCYFWGYRSYTWVLFDQWTCTMYIIITYIFLLLLFKCSFLLCHVWIYIILRFTHWIHWSALVTRCVEACSLLHYTAVLFFWTKNVPVF